MKSIALELFAGTKSFGKVAQSLGFSVISLDYNSKFQCSLTMDILDFIPGHTIKEKPCIIWASPDCTTFSYASSGFYRSKDGIAKNEKAIHGDKILQQTLDIIQFYIYHDPGVKYYIENPRGHMAKQKSMIDFLNHTNGVCHMITYCSYGGPYRKPTYIFTNDLNWKPRTRCGYKGRQKINTCHHECCKRCLRGGISSLGSSGDERRSIIPPALFEELINSYNKYEKNTSAAH